MYRMETVVGVFPNHQEAETAVKSLAGAGLDMKTLSLVGKGYHSDEKVMGFYGSGDRIRFWGSRGAFWGGFWGLFLGGVVLTIPVVGHVIVLGFLAAALISAAEGAAVVGGFSALAAAFYSIGIPDNSVIKYESDMKVDRFLVMAHGSDEEVGRAKTILDAANPTRLDVIGSMLPEPA